MKIGNKFLIGRLLVTGALLSAAGLIGTSVARAQNPPPGAIWDLVTVHPGVLNTDTLFTTSFVGDGNTEYVSFAFREAPAYFSFDDALVTAGGSSTNLLLNPGFELDTVNGSPYQNVPVDWGRWIQPVDTSAIGVVASNTFSYGCSNELAHSGTQFWCDGSVQGYDGIYQGIATTLGTTYNISFWLDDNSGSSITNPSIDTLVYAGDNIPVGTVSITPPPPIDGIPTPEPTSFLLLGMGLTALLVGSKWSKKSVQTLA